MSTNRLAGASHGSAGGIPPYRSAGRFARRPFSRCSISSAVAARCAGRPSAALNRLRAPSTIAAGKALPAGVSGMPPSARLPASRFRIASADAGCFGSSPNSSATLLVALCFLRPSIALPSTRAAFNKLAMPVWVNGRPGSATPRRTAKAGNRSGRNSATVPPDARWPSMAAPRQKAAARSSRAAAPV
jgi:hypothetical protein